MRKIIYLSFAVAFMFICNSAFSQHTIVMKAMNGTTKLNGGSVVPGHTGEIDLFSYSQGESSCVSCLKPNLSDYNIMTSLSHATTTFKKLLLNGTKLTSVDVSYINASGFTFYKIHMENVLVSSVQESGSTGADVNPTISVSLTADRIAWQYLANGGATRTSYGWDVVNNVEWLYY